MPCSAISLLNSGLHEVVWVKSARPTTLASGSKSPWASPCAPLPSASVQGQRRGRAGRTDVDGDGAPGLMDPFFRASELGN